MVTIVVLGLCHRNNDIMNAQERQEMLEQERSETRATSLLSS